MDEIEDTVDQMMGEQDEPLDNRAGRITAIERQAKQHLLELEELMNLLGDLNATDALRDLQEQLRFLAS